MTTTLLGSESASIAFSITEEELQIDYRCGEVRGPWTLFLALRTGAGLRSAVLPFSEDRRIEFS